MFRKFEYKNLVAGCIRKAATEHGIEILIMVVMEDHLHAVISIPSSMGIGRAIQLLKGRSSYLFFRHHEKARLRYPQGHLWSPGTFRTSIGYSDLPTTIRYVEQQPLHHAMK
jgi:putative transposase